MDLKHRVQQGDCIASIAEAHGFFWETLWKLPENSGLKQLRKEPTILQEGDVVQIPELREKEEHCGTEARHKFTRKGVPAILRMRILKTSETEEEENTVEPPDTEQEEVIFEDPDPVKAPADEPWKNAAYTLDIDGRLSKGKTDGDGKLEVMIPQGARDGMLIMEPGTPHERHFSLALGHLDPVTTVQGVADRLNHLGYGGGSRPKEMTPELAESIRVFQRVHGLKVTGEADQTTQDKLQELHGS